VLAGKIKKSNKKTTKQKTKKKNIKVAKRKTQDVLAGKKKKSNKKTTNQKKKKKTNPTTIETRDARKEQMCNRTGGNIDNKRTSLHASAARDIIQSA